MFHKFIKFNWKISSVMSAFAVNMAITYYDKVPSALNVKNHILNIKSAYASV